MPVPGGITIGVGVTDAVRSSPSGTVIATFERAAYVRFAGGIVALTGPAVPPGPLHMSSPLDLCDLSTGDTIASLGEWLADATVWRGTLPHPASAHAELLTPLADRSPLLVAPLAHRWASAIRGGELAETCRLLGGLGPGLTPSGDDALAGMLLAAWLRWPHAEDYLVALAARVDTHAIAQAFLTWAARGQSIEPVHRLLAGNARAAAELLAFGQSSGADLALGLRHGLRAGWREMHKESK